MTDSISTEIQNEGTNRTSQQHNKRENQGYFIHSAVKKGINNMAEACQPNHSSESSDRAREALDEITTLMEQETESKLHEVYRKLQKKLTAEIRFLKQAKKKNKISSNIPYLLGVFETVKQSDNVDQVICDQRKYGIIIDVVCEERTTWKKVVARNPQAMHLIWASDGQYGGKDIVRRMQRYVNAAKKESEFSPPKVICVFTKGVTGQMADHLESLGVQVQGTRVAVSDDTQQRLQVIEEFSDSEPELESSDYETDTDSEDESEAPKDTLTGISATVARMCTEEKVFLDVTSMVIFVSDVCNGGEDFEFEDLEMKTQAEQERKTPVYKFLKPYFDNCLLVTCDTALKNFMDFTKLLGGEKENERAKLLANRLTVVPDNMSDRFQRVIKRGRIKERARIIFGTADRLRCKILTSNDGFIRAAAAQGVTIAAVTHQSRALSEQKRLEETAKNL